MIHLTNLPFESLNINSPIFAAGFHALMFTITGIAIAPIPTLIVAPSVFLFIYLAVFVAPSNIRINNKTIEDKNKTLILNKIPHLDFIIKTKDNGCIIRFADFKFQLKQMEDLPIMLDLIAEKGNLVFFENYQLSNDTQVITYKGKHITTPRFHSLWMIYKDKSKLRISDIQNQNKWLEIPIISVSNATFIKSSSTFSKSKILIQTIQKIQIRENNRRIEIWCDNTIFFKSSIRKLRYELINLRDIEKIYSLLKNLDSLKHIKIEKII